MISQVLREWRNWQTRDLEVVMNFSCGFKSHLSYTRDHFLRRSLLATLILWLNHNKKVLRMIHSLEICLKSFTVQDLSHSIQQILGCCPKTWTLRLIPLPNHRRVFTVLRSPHIDKKSREQFQLTTHKTKLEFSISSADAASRREVLACLEAIKQLSSPGVQIQVQILASTAL